MIFLRGAGKSKSVRKTQEWSRYTYREVAFCKYQIKFDQNKIELDSKRFDSYLVVETTDIENVVSQLIHVNGDKFTQKNARVATMSKGKTYKLTDPEMVDSIWISF